MSIIERMLYIFDSKKNRQYVSQTTKLLHTFDKNNAPSESQAYEIEKHQDIFKRKQCPKKPWGLGY